MNGEAFAGGFLMGTGIETLSFKAQDINNQEEEKQGDVFITEYNGKSLLLQERKNKSNSSRCTRKTVEVKKVK